MPLLLMAGRTPLTQSGHIASRSASDAWARRVDDPAELPRAIDAALAAVAGGRQALLDVRMEHGVR